MTTAAPPRDAKAHKRLSTALDALAFVTFMAVFVWAPLALGGVSAIGLVGIRIGVLVAATLWLTGAASKGELVLPRPVPTLALLAYLAFVGASTMLSRNTYASVQGAINVLTYAIAFLVACGTLRTSRRRNAFIAVALVVASLVGTYGALQWLGVRWTPMVLDTRISSTYFNSNHYSGFLSLVIPLALGLMLFSRRFAVRAVCGFLTLLLLFNLALTFSWGLLGVCLVIVLLMLAWSRRVGTVRHLVSALALATALALGGIVAMVALSPQLNGTSFGSRTVDLVESYVATSVASRLAIAEGAVAIAAQHPWLGVGLGNFPFAFTEHRAPEVLNAGDRVTHVFVNYAHNDYLQVASETGLPSLILLLAFVLSVLARSKGAADTPTRLGLAAGVVALMLHGLTDGNMTIIPANSLWVFVFLGVFESDGVPRLMDTRLPDEAARSSTV